MSNEKIIQNLTNARALLETIHEQQMDLRVFRGDSECGTIGCALGWLAMSPAFAHIVHLVDESPARWSGPVPAPAGSPRAPTKTNHGYDFSWLDEHFGQSAFDRLFQINGCGYFDDEHPDFDGEHEYVMESDKALALWRIDQQIDLITRGMA